METTTAMFYICCYKIVKNNMEKLDKLIKDLNKDIFCGVGTQIFIQDLEDFKMDGLYGIVNGKYKLGVLCEKNIFVDATLKSDNMKLYDNEGNVLINLSDYGYKPIDFSEDVTVVFR